jgi:D-3-phosphoglycerate dehydrogenase
MKYKVLCTAPFLRFPKVVEKFHKTFDGEIIEYMEHKDILKEIKDYQGMIPNARIPLDNEILTNAHNLKAVYQPSMGYEHISVEILETLGISFNALGLDLNFKNTLWSTAEHAVSLMLALIKDLPKSINDVKDKGSWDNRKYNINDLRALRIGIVGLGNIGKKVSSICNAFGADIFAYDPYIKENDFPEFVKQEKSLSNLLEKIDLLTIHVPLKEDTHNLIGKNEFSNMKKGSYIINTSRGGVINEDALIEAIQQKIIIGAALDVLENESPFGVGGHKLVKFSKNKNNIIITPHLGGSSYPYMESIFLHSIEKLNKMLMQKT